MIRRRILQNMGSADIAHQGLVDPRSIEIDKIKGAEDEVVLRFLEDRREFDMM